MYNDIQKYSGYASAVSLEFINCYGNNDVIARNLDNVDTILNYDSSDSDDSFAVNDE